MVTLAQTRAQGVSPGEMAPSVFKMCFPRTGMKVEKGQEGVFPLAPSVLTTLASSPHTHLHELLFESDVKTHTGFTFNTRQVTWVNNPWRPSFCRYS